MMKILFLILVGLGDAILLAVIGAMAAFTIYALFFT